MKKIISKEENTKWLNDVSKNNLYVFVDSVGDICVLTYDACGYYRFSKLLSPCDSGCLYQQKSMAGAINLAMRYGHTVYEISDYQELIRFIKEYTV